MIINVTLFQETHFVNDIDLKVVPKIGTIIKLLGLQFFSDSNFLGHLRQTNLKDSLSLE